ncbi:IPT/TIG domain-containing protein [Pedobacter steynii]|uniref:IPT/TIG domain-containing protein n=3 Tax=Pedobacter steynii TaxID=430522 RepID=A0A1H0II10_9SPHI|nr:IPT/TIG domain-containing protein [Pedobacter steynii]
MKKGVFGFGLVLLVLGACKKDKTEIVKEPLKVTDYYPNSGNEGTLVTVEGTGFSSNPSAVSATFSGTPADVVSATPNAVVLRAPQKGSTGEIVMKVNGETLNIGRYTYQELSVRRISPANGAAGAHIRISGAGFSSLKGPAEVLINGKASVVVSASDTLLVVEVPVAVGTGPVKVKVDGKEAAGQIFKYQAIASISPLTGGKGTQVRVIGEGFEELAEGNYVDFNGKQALVKEASGTSLLVVAPAEVGTGPLSITINKQKVTGPVFTVVPPPVIETVSPLSGPGGSVMTIVGTTFSLIPEENKVSINGHIIPVTTASATKLTLMLPGNTGNGKVIVTVNDQVVQGPEFKDQSLGINSLSPENGLAGTHVTITGTGFNANAAQNTVTFNGLPASVISATETTIVVKAPIGLSTGLIKVVNNGAEAISPVVFSRAGVLTIAGGPGNKDLDISSFRTGSMAIDRQGNIFVLEVEKSRIKKINPQGVVTLFAGSPTGERGNKNGRGTEALFNFGANPGMDIDANDNLFISDGNLSVRKVSPQGEVSNFAIGFGNINKLAFDDRGILYVLGSFNGAWRINSEGLRTAINVNSMADGCRPVIVGNMIYKLNNENFYIDTYNLTTTQNLISVIGGSYGHVDGVGRTVAFASISGMAADNDGNLLVADGGNLAIRKVNLKTKEVTTLAKFTKGGTVDGSLTEAKVGNIGDVIVDKAGDIYFIDTNNNAIRKIFLK